jgi:hypothetical protein
LVIDEISVVGSPAAVRARVGGAARRIDVESLIGALRDGAAALRAAAQALKVLIETRS